MLLTTQGGAWFAGTPRGLNWFWEGWEEAAGRPDSARWQVPTLGSRLENGVLIREPHPLENPTIPWEEMVDAFDETPEGVFRQEYLAEWVDSGDAVFKTADIEAMAHGWHGLTAASGNKTITAWDIGRRADATVGITIDWSAQPWQIVAFERFQGLPYPGIQAAIEARHRAYPKGRTIVESNGPGDPVIENLAIKAEGFVTTARSKTDAITALQLALERGALKGNVPTLTKELKAYRWDDRQIVQDAVIALAIATFHLPRPSRTGGGSVYTPQYRSKAATIVGPRQEF
jgi:hypothetical protein